MNVHGYYLVEFHFFKSPILPVLVVVLGESPISILTIFDSPYLLRLEIEVSNCLIEDGE